MSKFKLDWEIADGITIQSLKQHKKYLKNELKSYYANPKSEGNIFGVWMHPEDVEMNKKVIEAINVVLKYYGE